MPQGSWEGADPHEKLTWTPLPKPKFKKKKRVNAAVFSLAPRSRGVWLPVSDCMGAKPQLNLLPRGARGKAPTGFSGGRIRPQGRQLLLASAWAFASCGSAARGHLTAACFSY